MARLIRSTACTTFAGLCALACATEYVTTATRGQVIDLRQPPQRLEGIEGAHEITYRDGLAIIAGQPSEEAWARFKELGVTAVVCLLTPDQLGNRKRVPYDEAAVVERLGMEFVHLPLGGREHPYTPAQPDQLAEVLRRAQGSVLVHCGGGGRAAYLWSAYLILDQGLDLNDALARAEVIVGPNPLEGLLGRDLKLVYVDQPKQTGKW